MDMDTKNRPLREAVHRWARQHGFGAGQRWNSATKMWEFHVDKLEIYISEDGVGHIEGESGLARSARGMTMLLNRMGLKR